MVKFNIEDTYSMEITFVRECLKRYTKINNKYSNDITANTVVQHLLIVLLQFFWIIEKVK